MPQVPWEHPGSDTYAPTLDGDMSTSRPNRALVGVAVLAGAAVLVLLVLAITRHGSAGEPAPTAAASASTTSSPTAPATTAVATPSSTPAPATPSSPVVEPTAQPTTSSHTRTPTTVTVTIAGWAAERAAVEVSGLADVVENGGTCTLTLTQGTRRASVSGAAEPDASSTSCGTLSVAGAGLGAGRWTGVLTYSSSTASGQSDPFTIEVPA